MYAHLPKVRENYFREHNISYTIKEVGAKYAYDFLIVHNDKYYIVEFDGRQHFEYEDRFHKDRGGLEERDRIKHRGAVSSE